MSDQPIGEASSHSPRWRTRPPRGQGRLPHRARQRLAAIVPADVAAAWEAAEDADDLEAAQAALDEPGESIPAEKLWAELGR
ncbi:MAG: hypothetical protein ACRDQ5_27760 [Sciscionella sp.]